MVKLDVSLLRFFEEEDFRVLTALEMSMRNHDVAPTVLVERIAQLPHGGVRKRLQILLKHKLIHHENTMYDGYAMKYGAYDFLALHTFSKRGTVTGVAHRIGCGKESDIILVHDENDQECVLKLQRLGRCSFRTVARNRDYKGNGKARHGESWFYLSRLASQKEFGFMKILHDEGFPVPKPIDQNRHALVMELVPGTVLNNVIALANPEKVYRRCLDLMIRLGEAGLIHGDFNEFNIMITEEQHVIMIDFPQMVSINHKNAAELFDRDVINLANFFTRRFKLKVIYFPTLEKDVVRKGDLDRQMFASGCFPKQLQANLESLLEDLQRDGAGKEENSEEEDDDDERDETREQCHNDDDEKEETKAIQASWSKNSTPATDHVRRMSLQDDASRKSVFCEIVPLLENAKEQKKNDEEKAVEESSENNSINDMEEEERKKREAHEKLMNSNSPYDQNGRPNVNYLPNGSINEEHLKKQVRKNIHGNEMHQFNKGLHRNTQKGRKKVAIKRQLRNTTAGSEFYD